MSGYHELSSEERSDWYSLVALSYERGRPKYPDSLIKHVASSSGLGTSSRILEIGAGPATATVAFAALGCMLTALEPNKEFIRIAENKCKQFANVAFLTVAFEEWPLPTLPFDLIFSASAFHWVDPVTGYRKVADALSQKGHFALLWNKEPQPSMETHRQLLRAYEKVSIAPPLPFESIEEQVSIVHRLGEPARQSGYFHEIGTIGEVVKIAYSANEYIALLQSFSSFINLNTDLANELYQNLRHIIDYELGGQLELSYLSTAQIFIHS